MIRMAAPRRGRHPQEASRWLRRPRRNGARRRRGDATLGVSYARLSLSPPSKVHLPIRRTFVLYSSLFYLSEKCLLNSTAPGVGWHLGMLINICHMLFRKGAEPGAAQARLALIGQEPALPRSSVSNDDLPHSSGHMTSAPHGYLCHAEPAPRWHLKVLGLWLIGAAAPYMFCSYLYYGMGVQEERCVLSAKSLSF